MNHRGGQGGGSTQVLSMGGAPGAGAQQMQYPHPNFSGMYVQSQLSNLQPQHQQHVNYPMSMPVSKLIFILKIVKRIKLIFL